MKVLLGPLNFAGQPGLLAAALRNHGVDAVSLTYRPQNQDIKFQTDHDIELTAEDRIQTQLETLKWIIEQNYDLIHFWHRSLYYGKAYHNLMGLDLSFLRQRHQRCIFRFTGFDLRLKSYMKERNPYNPFEYGFDVAYDERDQLAFLNYLRECVDRFVVQDPEMQEYLPEADVIPRALDVSEWPHIGPQNRDIPLVVHAPTNAPVKGTDIVLEAVEALQDEGLHFEFKLIQDMPHGEAIDWYQRADIIIDQLLIGWYGVLTMEGMALGKPTVAYVREDLLEGYPHDIPIANANPDTVKAVLRDLITDPEQRAELGHQGRAYVEEVHDVHKVVPQLIDLYQSVLDAPRREPTSFADIDYFRAQMEKHALVDPQELMELRYKAKRCRDLEDEISEIRHKARRYDKIERFVRKVPLGNLLLNQLLK